MRKRTGRNIAEVMRDEMVMKERVLSSLTADPKTIPAIAEELQIPSDEITYWVMALWRYGALEEVGKPDDEGYYSYRPAQ
jgi:hypothetical protein